MPVSIDVISLLHPVHPFPVPPPPLPPPSPRATTQHVRAVRGNYSGQSRTMQTAFKGKINKFSCGSTELDPVTSLNTFTCQSLALKRGFAPRKRKKKKSERVQSSDCVHVPVPLSLVGRRPSSSLRGGWERGDLGMMMMMS